jgi:hypothetical protein
MPKSISTALQAHLAQPVTTLATCWQVIRTDGESFAFTTLDQDLTIDGVTYQSQSGFSRTAVSSGSTGQVDNLQVTGFFDTAAISQQDLKNNLFDYATVYLFVVNWADLSQGILRLRMGTLGETVQTPVGGFQAELRGLTQNLLQELGIVYSPLCRADLGDSKCLIPIKPMTWAPGATYADGTYVQALTQTTDALRVAIFAIQGAGGITGDTEPAWNTTVGASTTDGTATWVSKAPYRTITTVTGVTDQKTFQASLSGLTNLGGNTTNQATIATNANISAGTQIEISDGIHTLGYTFPFATKGTDAIYQILTAIRTSNLEITATQSYYTLYLTNNSGVEGNISKTGDTLNALIIANFGDPPLDGGTLTWLTGANAGVSMEIKTYDQTSTMCQLWLSMYYPIAIGDKFFYYQGCDKRRDTCHNVFNNILNFRGEPDMPGIDAVLQYPNAT